MTEYHSEYHHPPYPEGYLLEGKVKPITEERQQALVEYIKTALADHVRNGGSSDEEDVFKIALASLTAEPVVWEIAGCIFSTEAEALKPGFRGTPEPLYEYPPVQVIKLTEPKDYDGKHSHYREGLADGYNQCLRQIKRLNGLERS